MLIYSFLPPLSTYRRSKSGASQTCWLTVRRVKRGWREGEERVKRGWREDGEKVKRGWREGGEGGGEGEEREKY